MVVALAVILLCKNAETPGAFLRHQVGGQGLRGGGWDVSLDIVSKFEPTILCDIRSWNYKTFPMVWASPVYTEHSRALTTRPRRLLEGDALVFPIIAHFDPLMWVIENPATGLLKTRPFMERLDVTYCKYEADAAVDQHALEAKARPAQARQPLPARGRTAGTGLRSGGRG